MQWSKKLIELRSGDESRQLAGILIEQSQEIPKVIDAITHHNPRVAWRAAWILDNFSRINAAALIPFTDQFCWLLINTTHQGVRRHLTNILCTFPPETIEDGRVVDVCLRWMTEEKTPIAVKANAMQLVANLCRIYPELSPELISIIELGMDNGSPGFKSRGKKIITTLESLITAPNR